MTDLWRLFFQVWGATVLHMKLESQKVDRNCDEKGRELFSTQISLVNDRSRSGKVEPCLRKTSMLTDEFLVISVTTDKQTNVS